MEPCVNKTMIHVIHPTVGYGISAHETCSCNELLALCNRHLIDRTYIKYEHQYFIENSKFLLNEVEALEPTAFLTIVNKYRGPKRKMYLSALKQLNEEGLNPRDYQIKMFVKAEKMPLEKVNTKPPRAIQARSPKYNLSIGRYLHVFEEWLYPRSGGGPSGTRSITKGLNPQEIAKLLIEKASWFRNPLFIAADHSKFDSTIRKEHLKFEHACYDKAFRSGYLRRLLHKQIVNRGRSRYGIRYRVTGTRMSGDFNTGLGNSLINFVVLKSFVKHVKAEILLDGDDSILIIEMDDRDKLDFTHFERMGFETTYEFFDDITQVDYCQCKLVLSTVPTMCRNPCRALSHAAVCLRKYTPDRYQLWFGNVADCLAQTNQGMPIYSVYYDYADTTTILDEDYTRRMEGVVRGRLKVERMPFFRTWGIDPEAQQRIESVLRNFKPYKNFKTKSNRKNDRIYSRRKQQTIAEGIAQRNAALCPTDFEFWCQFGQRPSQAIPGWTSAATTAAAESAARKKASEKTTHNNNECPPKEHGGRRLYHRSRHRSCDYYHGITAVVLC